ncbi:MAG TPA: MmgE/PrpD family protein [Candidatus Sulfotelmatobacter sp.]|nr:MmgE/PrpD family protein [Candidatus Sulfotelmatobacter sp.]
MAQTRLEPLVEQLLAVRFEQVPLEVVAKAKLCRMDPLGVALAGTTTPTGKAARAFALGMGGREESTLYRHGDRLSSLLAAYVNGTTAFCYNFTDTGPDRRPDQGCAGHRGQLRRRPPGVLHGPARRRVACSSRDPGAHTMARTRSDRPPRWDETLLRQA